MTTIEVETTDRTSTFATDYMILAAVCVLAVLGLAGIITMTL
jgi:hypothetical protein